MPLTLAEIRRAQPQDRSYKLTDGKGLTLLITPNGGRWWRLRYRIGGKERMLSLGTFPEVGLAEARQRRDDARAMIKRGVDPSAVRKTARTSAGLEDGPGTFRAVAAEWIARREVVWAARTKGKVIERLNRHVYPYIGSRPIREIEPPEVLSVVRRCEGQGTGEIAHRLLSYIGQVMRYAVATGQAGRDATADLRGVLTPVVGHHYPAVTNPKRVGEILRMIEEHTGEPTVRAALRIAPYVFVRPGELRHMRWADVDIEAREWRYTVTKTRTEHLVPLADPVVAILEELRPLTGHQGWVFLGLRGNRPISDMALGAALRRLGIDTRTEHTMHGWRATARTLLHEVLGYDPAVIEHQLAHRVPDMLGRAYNRTKFLGKRREMMDRWAKYLDTLRG